MGVSWEMTWRLEAEDGRPGRRQHSRQDAGTGSRGCGPVGCLTRDASRSSRISISVSCVHSPRQYSRTVRPQATEKASCSEILSCLSSAAWTRPSPTYRRSRNGDGSPSACGGLLLLVLVDRAVAGLDRPQGPPAAGGGARRCGSSAGSSATIGNSTSRRSRCRRGTSCGRRAGASCRPNRKPPAPAWLRRALGDEYFQDIAHVSFFVDIQKGIAAAATYNIGPADNALAKLSTQTRVRTLHLGGQQVTDKNLAYVGRMTGLEELIIFPGYRDHRRRRGPSRGAEEPPRAFPDQVRPDGRGPATPGRINEP